MIPNLQPNTLFAIHMRAPTPSGSKDWVGSVTSNNEIHTYWGKTGAISQHAAKHGNLAALHRLIAQKKNGRDSYACIDEYDHNVGWQSQMKSSPDIEEDEQKPALPAVEWIDAPDSSIQWDF